MIVRCMYFFFLEPNHSATAHSQTCLNYTNVCFILRVLTTLYLFLFCSNICTCGDANVLLMQIKTLTGDTAGSKSETKPIKNTA